MYFYIKHMVQSYALLNNDCGQSAFLSSLQGVVNIEIITNGKSFNSIPDVGCVFPKLYSWPIAFF